MTLTEAISREEALAYSFGERYKRLGEPVGDLKELEEEHKQMVKWLRELKKYRIAHWKLRDMDYEYDFNSIFGKNPMYYSEEVWNLFGDIDASVEYEVMGYEEVNADDNIQS